MTSALECFLLDTDDVSDLAKMQSVLPSPTPSLRVAPGLTRPWGVTYGLPLSRRHYDLSFCLIL